MGTLQSLLPKSTRQGTGGSAQTGTAYREGGAEPPRTGGPQSGWRPRQLIGPVPPSLLKQSSYLSIQTLMEHIILGPGTFSGSPLQTGLTSQTVTSCASQPCPTPASQPHLSLPKSYSALQSAWFLPFPHESFPLLNAVLSLPFLLSFFSLALLRMVHVPPPP